jgi:hypothetical protein
MPSGRRGAHTRRVARAGTSDVSGARSGAVRAASSPRRRAAGRTCSCGTSSNGALRVPLRWISRRSFTTVRCIGMPLSTAISRGERSEVSEGSAPDTASASALTSWPSAPSVGVRSKRSMPDASASCL